MRTLAHLERHRWHDQTLLVGIFACAALAACGSSRSSPNEPEDGRDPTGAESDDGRDATGAESEGGTDAGSDDAMMPPEPCAEPPVGEWAISYTGASTRCIVSSGAELTVSMAEGGASVDYRPCAVALGAPGCSASGSFERGRCAIHATTDSRGIYFGETQCDSTELTLYFHGEFAEGTMIHTKCWCTNYPPTAEAFRATAVRKSSASR